ncbi:hypothetical protein [Natrinema sp. H-ect4]|jgi:hypothetical protein|uniref:hypothetical protein n=1 Tax=Natrinema sp. H-ect4 TaxID=3242699 RepID=UPI0035A96124
MKYNTEKSVVSPDGLGPRFGVLVGSYVAALIAPTLTLFTVEYLGWRSKVLAFTVLGTIGITIGSGTAFLTTDNGQIASWLNSGWVAWLFPLLGLVPMIAYHFSVLEVVAVYLIDPASIPVSSLVGATGFLLGIVAAVAGEIAIRAARNRVASSAIESENVLIEWTSRWPRGHRIKVQVFTMVTGLVLVGLLSFWLPPHLTVLTALVVVVTVSSTTNTVLSDRAYKLTPAGLELRRSGSGKLVTWCQFIPMSQIKYVTVLENHVILHRSGLLPSIRFDRNDLRFDDEEIINNLEEYLNRRE